MERLDQQLEDWSSKFRDWFCLILDSLHKLRNVSRAFGHDDAELGQMATQGIHDLGPLSHQQIAGSEYDG
jgi:hypothetical protein